MPLLVVMSVPITDQLVVQQTLCFIMEAMRVWLNERSI